MKKQKKRQLQEKLKAMNKPLEEKLGALGQELPDLMRGFKKVQKEAVKDGAISAKMKEVMLVAISVSLRCEVCIRHHLVAAIGLGASRAEIVEAVGTAINMAGGPAVGYGATVVLEVLEELDIR
jgi:AhpD family alkylhydroperoxidase